MADIRASLARGERAKTIATMELVGTVAYLVSGGGLIGLPIIWILVWLLAELGVAIEGFFRRSAQRVRERKRSGDSHR